MPWIFLLLAIGALTVAFRTTSVAVLAVCLLAAMGLLLAWILGLVAQRVGNSRRDETSMIDGAELKRLRELAEQSRQGNKLVRDDYVPPV